MDRLAQGPSRIRAAWAYPVAPPRDGWHPGRVFFSARALRSPVGVDLSWRSAVEAAGADAGLRAAAGPLLLALPLLPRLLGRRRRRRRRHLLRGARGGEECSDPSGGEKLHAQYPHAAALQRAPSAPARRFGLTTKMFPRGDQPQALDRAVTHLRGEGKRFVTLQGATGTGKTFVMAKIIEELQLPCLMLCHNKSLAKQTQEKLAGLFGETIPVDLYTSAFSTFRPSMLVSRSPRLWPDDEDNNEGGAAGAGAGAGAGRRRGAGGRSEGFGRGGVRYIRGDAGVDHVSLRRRQACISGLEAGERRIAVASSSAIFPGSRLTTVLKKDRDEAIAAIEAALGKTMTYFELYGGDGTGDGPDPLESIERLENTVAEDIEKIRKTGTCPEMVSKYAHLFGSRSRMTLIDHFDDAYGTDWICILDESHMTIPHLLTIGGIGERERRLVKYGYRLAATLDAGPQRVEDIAEKLPDQVIFASATPGQHAEAFLNEFHEPQHCTIEMLQRPTHILEPVMDLRVVTEGQESSVYSEMINEIRKEVAQGRQCIVACFRKAEAESVAGIIHGFYVDPTDSEKGTMRADFINCDLENSAREALLDSFRRGALDVLVGVNLLREGLDFPNVSLVIVLQAGKGGFLRTNAAITQLAGRAARNPHGRCILFTDGKNKGHLDGCIQESRYRREQQLKFNNDHGFKPEHITSTSNVKPGGDAEGLRPTTFSTPWRSSPVAVGKSQGAANCTSLPGVGSKWRKSAR